VLIIDSLGVQHYMDVASRRPDLYRRGGAGTTALASAAADSPCAGGGNSDDYGGVEQAITSVLRNLLRVSRLTCFVSKCNLFEGTPSPVSPWPFDPRLRPVVPAETMPTSWAALSTRVLVLSRIVSGATARSALLLERPSSSLSASTPKASAAVAPFDIDESGLWFGPVLLPLGSPPRANLQTSLLPQQPQPVTL
jgi:hypothetical protein